MDGFLFIDKPKGITSHRVVDQIRKILRIRKVGHAGSLDPHATGILVVGIGKATRFLPFLMDLPKTYVATIRLGILTDTLDITGEVLRREGVPSLQRATIEQILRTFRGEIEQTPPAYSAKKIRGQRLYELARAGVLVTPPKKRVTIYDLDCIDFDATRLHIRVRVSKGTYIRSLARDIAQALKTVGVVEELRRTAIGPYKVEEAIPLEDEEGIRANLKSLGEGLRHLPEVVLKPGGLLRFVNGNRVALHGIAHRGGSMFQHVRVYDPDHHFLGIGMLTWEGLYPERLLPFEEKKR